MQWIAILGMAGVLAAASVALGEDNSLNAATVRQYLQQGAKIIDVRTTDEFSEGHLSKAVNIPLDDLKERIGREAPNKEAVLLLHCAGGGRSASGTKALRAMGYKNVFNLGGFEDAAKLVGEAKK